MKIAEKLLLSLSKEYVQGDSTVREFNPEASLELLRRVFPNFKNTISEKSVLDFGCGAGRQSVALHMFGARYVVGLDTNERHLSKARDLAMKYCPNNNIEFVSSIEGRLHGKFDIVISQNSMEHFSDPTATIKDMKLMLNKDGVILVTFGPPWFAPYGSHMHFFTQVPWVNILFSERTVMNVRAHFRNDGATRYEEVESGLNRMSVAKFETIIANCGMRIQQKNYECVRRFNFFSEIPIVRELFINRVSCILSQLPI